MLLKTICLLITVFFLSCSSQRTDESKIEVHLPVSIEKQGRTEKSSWHGSYSGTIPCASCDGIKMYLTIYPNRTYKLSQEYLGVDLPSNSFDLSGEFNWVSYPSEIQLDNQDQFKFKIDPGTAVFLDTDGQIIDGDLAKKYILLKDVN